MLSTSLMFICIDSHAGGWAIPGSGEVDRIPTTTYTISNLAPALHSTGQNDENMMPALVTHQSALPPPREHDVISGSIPCFRWKARNVYHKFGETCMRVCMTQNAAQVVAENRHLMMVNRFLLYS